MELESNQKHRDSINIENPRQPTAYERGTVS